MIAIIFTTDSSYNGESLGEVGGVIASLIILHTTMRKLGNHLCKTNFVTIKLVPIFSKPTKLCTQTRFMWNFPNMLLGLLVAHLRLLHFMRVNYAMSPN